MAPKPAARNPSTNDKGDWFKSSPDQKRLQSRHCLEVFVKSVSAMGQGTIFPFLGPKLLTNFSYDVGREVEREIEILFFLKGGRSSGGAETQ